MAGLTVLWKSSIVNSVKPWDTRSSLLLADTALNLGGGGKGGRHGLTGQQRGRPRAGAPAKAGRGVRGCSSARNTRAGAQQGIGP